MFLDPVLFLHKMQPVCILFLYQMLFIKLFHYWMNQEQESSSRGTVLPISMWSNDQIQQS